MRESWAHRLARVVAAGIIFLPAVALSALAGSPVQFGSGSITWPTNWVALTELNDPKDITGTISAETDFVGDAGAAGAFYAVNDDYVFFRVRVRVGTVDMSTVPSPTFNRDTFRIYINPFDDLNPRYAFAWDAKGRPYVDHGLEMNVKGKDETLTQWDQLSMADLDGNENAKIAPPDFRWLSADGFVRITDRQPTPTFGDTTFIDWAISKRYLAANVPELLVYHTWHINFGSQTDGQDNDKPNADVGGGAQASDPFRYSRWIDINTATP